MAFNLIAQLQIQAPTNLGRIASQIRGQLKNISATVDVKINPSSTAGIVALNQQVTLLNTSLRQLTVNASSASSALSGLGRGFASSTSGSAAAAGSLKSVSAATNNLIRETTDAKNATEEFGRAAGLAGRRFLGFSVVAGTVVGSLAAIKGGFVEALKFEREFIKISQTGGATKSELVSLNNEITRLSSNLGVSSKDLVTTSVTLRQAGLSIKEVNAALDTLAKTTLTPSFDNIKDTTEGTIAVMAQFKIEAKDLEKALGSANAVAAAFAVESKDIVTAVQRSGGAFKSVGGDLNEFIALFTSVRSTTRESAESIATGLRTVFTRLQRKDTVEALKDLGVNLRYTRQEALALGQVDLENQFVGAYEAVRRLSEALSKIRTTDTRYSEVVEQLGGYRQISKVIPLLQEFTTSQKALNVAQSGFASITTSAEEAQTTFIVKIQKVKEQFLGLARTIASSNSFQGFLDKSLRLAKAFLSISEALTPLIPALTALAAIRLASNISSFVSGTAQGFSGVGPKRLASGGFVGGSGNGDTVPAMLTPGEFVINRKAAQSIGYGKLGRMNAGGGVQKFAKGGQVFKVGDYDLSANNTKWLYALAGAKDDGESLLKNPNNQRALAGILGSAPKGGYTSKKEIFEKLGFTGQNLTEFSSNIKQSQKFIEKRKDAIKNNQYIDAKGNFIVPFKGETIGALTSGVSGGEAGKQGRDTLNAGVRLADLSINNLGSKVNKTAESLMQAAGVKKISGGVNVHILSSAPTNDFKDSVVADIQDSIQSIYQNKFGFGKVSPLNKGQTDGISGYLFEKYVEGVSGRFTANGGDSASAAFEYTKGSPSDLGKSLNKFVFPSPIKDDYLDVKSRYNRGIIESIIKKYLNVKTTDGGLASALGVGLGKNTPGTPSPADSNKPELKFATGGVVPGSGYGDTVPARLTPGEFVIKKSSAKAIGYNNLSQMNRYADGGQVIELNPPKDKVGLLYLDHPSNDIGSQSGIVKYIYDARKLAKGETLDRLTAKPQDLYKEGSSIVRPLLVPPGQTGPKAGLSKQEIDDYVNGYSYLPQNLQDSLRSHITLGRGNKVANFTKDFAAYAQTKKAKNPSINIGGKNISTGKSTTQPNDNIAVNIETRPISTVGASKNVKFASVLDDSIKQTIANTANSFSALLPNSKTFTSSNITNSLLQSSITQQGRGRLFEAVVRTIGNNQKSNVSDTFDFAPTNKDVSSLFGGGLEGVYSDVKIANSTGAIKSVAAKAVRQFFSTESTLNSLTGAKSGLSPAIISKNQTDFRVSGGTTTPKYLERFKFATGGSAKGQDTIPAMLTPGEYVINKGAASRIGLGNLNHMNSTGKVRGYNKGGSVQYLTDGGEPEPDVASPDSYRVRKITIKQFEIDLKRSFENIGKYAEEAFEIAKKKGVNSKEYQKVNKQLTGVQEYYSQLKSLEDSSPLLRSGIADKTSNIYYTEDKKSGAVNIARVAGTQTFNGQKIPLEANNENNPAVKRKRGEAEARRQEEQMRAERAALGSSIDNLPTLAEKERQEQEDRRNRVAARAFAPVPGGVYAKNLAAKRTGLEEQEASNQKLSDYKLFEAKSKQDFDAGLISEQSFESIKKKGSDLRNENQNVRAKTRDSLASEQEKIAKELVASEEARIKALNLGIKDLEVNRIAQENVNKALIAQSRIIVDGNNKAVGLEATAGSGAATLKLEGEALRKFSEAKNSAKNSVLEPPVNPINVGEQNNVAAKEGRFSRIKQRLAGPAILGLSLGASYGSQLFDNKQSDFDLAASSGDSSSVKRNAGVSGAFTGVAAGAGIGSVFGPLGIAVGGVVGGIYGFRDSLKDAEKQIKELKISKSLSELSETIEGVNKSNRLLTAEDRVKISSKSSSINSEIESKASDEASSFFTGFDIKKYEATVSKERRSTIGKELPGFYEILNRESQKLGENFAKNNSVLDSGSFEEVKKSLDSLDSAFIEANKSMLSDIASFKGISIQEAAKDFTKSRVEGFNVSRRKEFSESTSINLGQQLGNFNRLSQIVEQVSNSMRRLDVTSINLNDTFDNTISNVFSTDSNFSDVDSKTFQQNVSGLDGVLGGAGNDLSVYANEFNNIKNKLGTVLTDVLSRPIIEGDDVGLKLKESLTESLGGVGNDARKAIIDSISKNAGLEGAKGLKLSSGTNIRSTVDKLTSESSPIEDLSKITNPLKENANKFVNELIKGSSRLQRIGEQEDRLSQAKLAKILNDNDQLAESQGRKNGALDRVSLDTLQSPQNERSRGLTGLGDNSENVEAISNKLNKLNKEIDDATNAQQANKFITEASREAGKELIDLKRQSGNLQIALKDLTDTSVRNNAAQQKLSKIQEDRSSRLSFGEKFVRADRSEKIEINRGIRLTNQAATQGSLNGFRPEQVRSILDTLGSLGNAKVNFGGKQQRASDVKDNLLKEVFGGIFNVDKEAVKEEIDLNKVISQNFATREAAEQKILELQKTTNDKLVEDLRKVQNEFFANLAISLSKDEVDKVEQKLALVKNEKGDLETRQVAATKIRGDLGLGVSDTEIDTLKARSADVQKLFSADNEIKEARKNLQFTKERTPGQGDINSSEGIVRYNLKNSQIAFDDDSSFKDSDELKKVILGVVKAQGLGGKIDEAAVAERAYKLGIRQDAFGTALVGSGNVTKQTQSRDINDAIGASIAASLSKTLDEKKDQRAKAAAGLKDSFTPETFSKLSGLSESGKTFTDFAKNLEQFNKDNSLSKLNEELTKLSVTIGKLEAEVAAKKAAVPVKPPVVPGIFGAIGAAIAAPGIATGGPVPSGDSTAKVFKAKGSDTVPAMLTPGEYVINASAASANRGLLEDINSGKGKKVNYLANGGPVAALPGNDNEFGKFLNGLSDKGFDYVYKLGAPKLADFYRSVQVGKARGKFKGQGDEIIREIEAFGRNPNPDNRFDKSQLLQKLPPNAKAQLTGALNKLSSDFESYDKMTPQQLLGFYGNTVYPYLQKKKAEIFPNLMKYQNLAIAEGQKPEPNRLEEFQKKYDKVERYYDNFRTWITPEKARKFDLTEGTKDRQDLLNVIKKGYYGGFEAPDLTEAANKLLPGNKVVEKQARIEDKQADAKENARLKVAQVKQAEAEALELKAIQDADILAAKSVADYRESFMENRDFRASMVKKYKLPVGSEDKLEQLGFPQEETTKLKDLKNMLAFRKKASDAALEKGAKLSAKKPGFNVADYNAEIATTAASVSTVKEIDYLAGEVRNIEKKPLELDETVEERAKKTLEQKNYLEKAQNGRRTGGLSNDLHIDKLSPAERALAEQKQLADIQDEVKTKNKINAFVDRDKVGLDLRRDRIAAREKLLKLGPDGDYGKFTLAEFNDASEGKKEWKGTIKKVFNQWKSSLEELGKVQGTVGRDNTFEFADERRRYNELLQITSDFRFPLPPEKFATGGFVGGSGHGDVVPAMLTPGEFVLNTSAVKTIGLANLHHMNNAGRTAKMAAGGVVGAANNTGGSTFTSAADFSQAVSRFENSLSILRTAFGAFNNAASALTQAMQNFPSSIIGNFTHAVNVNITGAEALAALSPELEKIAVNKAKQVLSQYVKKNFPEAGLVEE